MAPTYLCKWWQSPTILPDFKLTISPPIHLISIIISPKSWKLQFTHTHTHTQQISSQTIGYHRPPKHLPICYQMRAPLTWGNSSCSWAMFHNLALGLHMSLRLWSKVKHLSSIPTYIWWHFSLPLLLNFANYEENIIQITMLVTKCNVYFHFVLLAKWLWNCKIHIS